MSNTSQKKPDKEALSAAQAKLIEQARAAGKLTTEELVAVLSPLGADMTDIEDTYQALTEAGVEVVPDSEEDSLDNAAPSTQQP